MATYSSVLAWRIPGMGEPGGLPSMGSHRVGHDWSDVAAAAAVCVCIYIYIYTFHFHALEKEMATHSSVLAWRIPGMGEPGGLPSMGLHRVRHDWNDLAVAAAERERCLYVLDIYTVIFTDEIIQSKVCFKIMCVVGCVCGWDKTGCLLSLTVESRW